MIFSVVDDEVKVLAATLHIPEFKKIWELDKSKKKEKSNGLFAAVYHIIDPKSPYSNIENEIRESEVLHDLELKLDQAEFELLHICIEKYKVLITTPSLRFLNASEIALDNISNHIKDVNIQSGTGGNIAHVMKAIQDGSAIMIKLSSLREQYEKELQTNNKRRGGVEPSAIMEED